MGEPHTPHPPTDVYERLIDRLGLALETARTSVRLRDEQPTELELRGLSRAEYDVLKTYLDALPAHPGPAAEAPRQRPARRTAEVVWLRDRKRRDTSTPAQRLPVR
ncbi:hypothetical protein [Pseudomonas entomophila]|uniref:hypothetical protein n=1 Tax=Pseudomonas entomophila TaxID=312306 RepID=UPI003EC0950B